VVDRPNLADTADTADTLNSITDWGFGILILLALPGLVLPIFYYFKILGNKVAYKIVLLRHGESIWNKENRFTGWTDVGLSELGMKEAHESGKTLKKEGYDFDLVFTSVLKRATDTTNIVLEELGQEKTDVHYAWQLNERHYGSLQGLNKAEMAQKYGEEQVHIWRRSYSVRPPAMDDVQYENQNNQEIFKSVPKDKMPRTESLSDTYDRAVAYWNADIAPAIKAQKKILISAHGNSLRAVVKYLDNIGDDEISKLNIPTGVPLVYELDDNLKPIKHYYLGDAAAIAFQTEKVKNQGKIK
jgi:2,3-bisphosphoglycerate-dependent phosphoglycerate mutase